MEKMNASEVPDVFKTEGPVPEVYEFDAAGKGKEQEVKAEGQEGRVTPEILAGNVEKLQTNINKIDEIPKSVLESPEGQEETKSLQSKVMEKVRGLGNSIVEKFAKLDSWEAKDTFFKYAASAGIAMLVGPALIQWARSQYPEVGVLLDSAPDALQQVIHFDAWAHFTNLFTGDSLGNVWQGGSIEAGNLLADIGSGKINVSSLSGDQMEMLHGNMGDNFDLIKALADKGNLEAARHFATGDSVIGSALTGLGNSTLFASAALPIGGLLSKILKIRDTKSERINK